MLQFRTLVSLRFAVDDPGVEPTPLALAHDRVDGYPVGATSHSMDIGASPR